LVKPLGNLVYRFPRTPQDCEYPYVTHWTREKTKSHLMDQDRLKTGKRKLVVDKKKLLSLEYQKVERQFETKRYFKYIYIYI
jgi:hypothetical protein